MPSPAIASRICSFVPALLATVAAGGCVRQVFSPPAGYLSIEEPRRLDPGEVRVGATFGAGGVGIGADLLGGSLKYRRGLDDVEVSGELAAVVVDEASAADTFPAILSSRVGIKGHFAPDFRHLAWRAGLGLGGSAGGIFAAADAGLVLGFDNPWVVPWIQGGGVASVPLTSSEVDITTPDDDDSIVDHPVTTFGAQVSAGLTVHLGGYATASFGIAWLTLRDVDGVAEESTNLGGTLEIPL